MNAEELKQKIADLKIWKKRDERAPHKPLTILYALGRLQNENTREFHYEEAREKLTNLLMEFGPPRKSYHPEQPFVRLQGDGIWKLNQRVDRPQIKNRYLIENDVIGGFKESVYDLFKQDATLVREVAEFLLNEHFPDTIHEDILLEVGLNLGTYRRRTRDPRFREKILRAYEFSCAVCGFNVRLGHNLVAIEAAHIKWHQSGGPDEEENGIALCSLHHKLFDRGVFTFNKSKKLLVSEKAHGTNGFEEWLLRYHGQPIREPISPHYQPKQSYLDWHVHEVFKGEARYVSG
ncbi:restriction endonuclease [Ammoniphilus oxalaticus]|uniref:Restriction endonuclease n=1 Tax=Ammoniphilus oxalaticus TaxID=66863 RepID=A0A419SKR8_9BACL|nr:HNH endonuclease [Ammoniphilus oxalaticus]RKD24549.1 restriction endonuclease [Ammoniphilus oxalaticus]